MAAPHVSRWVQERYTPAESDENLILVAASNPDTTKALVHLGSIIAQASEDAYICVMSVAPRTGQASSAAGRDRRGNPVHGSMPGGIRSRRTRLTGTWRCTPRCATALSVSEGILDEVASHRNAKLLVVGWPGSLNGRTLAENPVKVALQKAHTNVAVLLDRGLGEPKRILVPVGGGIHSRMALRLANEIAISDNAQVTALRLLVGPAKADGDEEVEDQTALLAEIIEEALGGVPTYFELQVVQAQSVQEGILRAAGECSHDLIVLGASEEWSLDTRLFGTVDDWIAERAPCSVVFCRRYEPVAMAWLRYRVKVIGDAYDQE